MANEAEQTGQDEIKQLLQQARGSAAAAGPSASPEEVPPGPQELARPEIDSLLDGVGEPRGSANAESFGDGGRFAASPPAATARQKVVAPVSSAGDDMQLLLAQAEQAIASITEPAETALEGIKPYRWEEFSGTPASSEKATLELVRDVELDLKIELGRTRMRLEDVLRLRRGAVVTLDKLAGDPVDIFVNGRLIARGEVLVFNDSFCVRVAELIAAGDAR
jgi:flagellar motor switch protein FliN/FliY